MYMGRWLRVFPQSCSGAYIHLQYARVLVKGVLPCGEVG